MSFEHRIRVRYGEVDAQGVVFNGHWLAYFDDALTQFFGWLGYDPRTMFSTDFDVMLVKAVLEWRGSVGFDDEIGITVVPTRFGTSSFDLTFEAHDPDGASIVTAVITYVSIIPGENRSRPIPDEVRGRLEGAADGGGTPR